MFHPRRFLLTRALVPNISALSANWALNGTPTKSDVIQAKFADFAGFARSHTSKIQAGPLEFEESQGRKKTNGKLIVRREGSLQQRQNWPEYSEWLDDMGSRFSQLAKSRIFREIRDL